jgi:hypothetical protein
VMRGAAVEDAQVNVGSRRLGEALEEVFDQFGLEIADALGVYFSAADTMSVSSMGIRK